MKRLERTFLHLRNRHKKTGFTLYHDFLNPPDFAGDNGRFTRHRFQVNDAKRFVDRRTTENSGVRIKLDHTSFIEHLIDPNDAVAGTPCLFHRGLHFPGNFRRIGRAGAEHNLEIFIHELNGMDEMNNSLLMGNASDEKKVRFFRINAEFAQGIGRFGRAIFFEIDAVIDHVQAFVSDIE